MTSPQRNENIGSIRCWTPGCGFQAALRRDSGKRLYYVCPGCGRVTAPGDVAQQAMNDHASIWGTGGTPPGDTPTWIAERWPWNKMLRRIHTDALEPYGGDGPARPAGGERLPPFREAATSDPVQPGKPNIEGPAGEGEKPPGDPDPADGTPTDSGDEGYSAAQGEGGRRRDEDAEPGRIPDPPDDEPEGEDEDREGGFWDD